MDGWLRRLWSSCFGFLGSEFSRRNYDVKARKKEQQKIYDRRKMLAAQAIDGNSSLGNASLVYQFGFWAGAAIPIGLRVCLILTGTVYGKRLNKMSMLTLPDFYYRRFGNAAEGISGVLMMISFIVLVAGNFAASGFILSTVLGIDFIWAMLIAAIVVLIYTYAGGLFSSAYLIFSRFILQSVLFGQHLSFLQQVSQASTLVPFLGTLRQNI